MYLKRYDNIGGTKKNKGTVSIWGICFRNLDETNQINKKD